MVVEKVVFFAQQSIDILNALQENGLSVLALEELLSEVVVIGIAQSVKETLLEKGSPSPDTLDLLNYSPALLDLLIIKVVLYRKVSRKCKLLLDYLDESSEYGSFEGHIIFPCVLVFLFPFFDFLVVNTVVLKRSSSLFRHISFASIMIFFIIFLVEI